jgi:hypothetical protein
MIDPLVERRYSDCRELLNLWRRYHDFFKVAVTGDGITPDKEHEFITVKSRIAMLHDIFMDCLDHDQNIGQNVLSIVTRSITLKHVHRMSTAEIKKIELEWHESYLLLNETLGMLDDKRRQFANVTPSKYYRQLYTKKAAKALRDFVTSWVFKTIVVLAVLMVGVFAAMQFGLMDKVANWPPTRKLVIKFEDLLRFAVKEYPYRDLESLQRLDGSITPQDIQGPRLPNISQAGYRPEDGISKVVAKMGGGANDVSAEMKQYDKDKIRVETYSPGMGSALGGVECVVWLYHFPSRQIPLAIEAKYKTWWGQLPADRQPDWAFFRKANVIGVAFGGDDGGRIRNWVRDQYLRIRRK